MQMGVFLQKFVGAFSEMAKWQLQTALVLNMLWFGKEWGFVIQFG